MKVNDFAATIKDCRFCWMCRHICPVANETAKETNTPRGKALTLWTVLAGMTDFQDKDIVQTLYECSLCEACKYSCVTDRDMPSAIIAARADVVNKGYVPEHVQRVAEAIISCDNPWGRSKEEKIPELQNELVGLPEEADVLLYLGCTPRYYQTGVAIAAIKILKKAGVNFTVLGEEGCCGMPLWRLGYQDEARQKGNKNLDLISKSKCRTIITLCASCYQAFKHDYVSQFGLHLEPGIRVMHSSEFLLELLQQGLIKPWQGMAKKVTFHDPCILARKFELSEAPREIMASIKGLRLTEMRWNHGDTHCCGSSLLHLLYPELAQKVTATRLGEAQETGAELVVTTCPGCKNNLNKLGTISVIELNELLVGVL